MTVEKIMFSLIKSEIAGGSTEDIKAELNPDVLNALFKLSDKHDMSHIVASALSNLKALSNDEISQKFNKTLMLSVYRDSLKDFAITQVGEILEKEKIPHIPLKGTVLRKLYPKSWMRTSCDIDVLVKEEDCERAIETLCKEGFKRTADCSTHDYNLVSSNNFHVELHYTLTQEESLITADKILDKVFDYAYPEKDGGYSYALPYEIMLIYHLAHMARHLIHGGCGIRPFIDLWLMNEKIPHDEKAVSESLEKAGLFDFYNASLSLSRCWLENEDYTDKTKTLEEFILFGGVYGNTLNAANVKAGKGDGKLKSFIGLVFLPRKNLEVLYPNLKKHKILLPFYQVKRWLKVFDRKKFNKIKRITNARNSVDVKDSEKIKDMLDFLGFKK